MDIQVKMEIEHQVGLTIRNYIYFSLKVNKSQVRLVWRIYGDLDIAEKLEIIFIARLDRELWILNNRNKTDLGVQSSGSQLILDFGIYV